MTVASFDSRTVSAEKIEAACAVIRTAKRLALETFGCDDAIVAYSGGKDGLVAALIARSMNVVNGVCEESFYFTEQRADVRGTAQRLGVNVEYRDSLSMAWLASHQKFVFPHGDNESFNQLCQRRQRRTMERFASDRSARVIVTGRKSHGNCVKAPVYVKGGRFVYCHPVHDWIDADVWGYLSQSGVERPWVYGTEVGTKEGNTPWILFRQFPDALSNWRVVHSIEPAIVRTAAEFNIRDARKSLSVIEGER